MKISNFSLLSRIFLSSKTSRKRLSFVSISCFSTALANLTKNSKLVISNFNSSKDHTSVLLFFSQENLLDGEFKEPDIEAFLS